MLSSIMTHLPRVSFDDPWLLATIPACTSKRRQAYCVLLTLSVYDAYPGLIATDLVALLVL